MRTSILVAQVTDEQLKAADIIVAVDPNLPDYEQQVYGQESVPSGRSAEAGAYEIKVVEVSIASTDDGQLQRLLRKVEAVKGHLPQAVRPLKRPTSAA